MAGMRLALARLFPLLSVSADVAAMGLQRGTVRRSTRLAGVKVAATSSYKSQPGARRSLGARSCTTGSMPTSPSPPPSSSKSSKSKSKLSKSKPESSKSESSKPESSKQKLSSKTASSRSKPSEKSEASESDSDKSKSSTKSKASKSKLDKLKSNKSKSDSSSEAAIEGGGGKAVGDGRSSKRVSNAKARVVAGVSKTKKKSVATLGRTRENVSGRNPESGD